MTILDTPKAALGLGLALSLSLASCLESVSFKPGRTVDGKLSGTVCVTAASASAAGSNMASAPPAGTVQ